MNYLKHLDMLTIFIIFLLLIQIIYPQNVSKLIKHKSTNKKVEYSILVDMKKIFGK